MQLRIFAKELNVKWLILDISHPNQNYVLAFYSKWRMNIHRNLLKYSISSSTSQLTFHMPFLIDVLVRTLASPTETSILAWINSPLLYFDIFLLKINPNSKKQTSKIHHYY
jgi:hypothetical protein